MDAAPGIDQYRADVIALFLGAADFRDMASDAVGVLALSAVVAARMQFLGEPHDQAVSVEHARTDYPDLEYIQPGGPLPSEVWKERSS